MAHIERHLALRIGFPVSDEEEPCYSAWKPQSGRVEPSKLFLSLCFSLFGGSTDTATDWSVSCRSVITHAKPSSAIRQWKP